MGYSEIYFRIATFRKQITHTESLFAGYSWYSVTDNSICLNLIEDFRHLQLKVDPLHRLDTGHSWRYTITLNVTAFFWHKTFNKRALQNAFYFCVKSSSQTSLTLFSDVVLKLSRLFQVDPLTGNCATSTETLILHWLTLSYKGVIIIKSYCTIYIITNCKSMRAFWLATQLWVIVPVNPRKNRASSEFLYKAIDHKFLWVIGW